MLSLVKTVKYVDSRESIMHSLLGKFNYYTQLKPTIPESHEITVQIRTLCAVIYIYSQGREERKNNVHPLVQCDLSYILKLLSTRINKINC